MSTLNEVREGDIVLATKFIDWTDEAPIWFVVTGPSTGDMDNGRVAYWDVTLLTELLTETGRHPVGELSGLEDSDTFDIIPPDEVPAHVHAALMKLNLGG